jgi:hypothetical protein
MARVNLSGMGVEALIDLRKRVDEMLLERRAEIEIKAKMHMMMKSFFVATALIAAASSAQAQSYYWNSRRVVVDPPTAAQRAAADEEARRQEKARDAAEPEARCSAVSSNERRA